MKEIRGLIVAGPTEDNLKKLTKLCDRKNSPDLLVCGIVSLVCHRLLDEYDEQGIPTARYLQILAALQQPMLALVDSCSARPETVVKNLGALLKAFRSL